MKFILFLSLFFVLLATAGQAQTAAVTPTSVEIITPSAATRAFYDLDDVFFRYKAGNVIIYEAATGTTLFNGDSSEVSFTGASYWAAKMSKLNLWYQRATTTTGFNYFFPKRGVVLQYRNSSGTVRAVHATTKRTMAETAIDSIKISGVTGASNILTYFRSQYYQEGKRDNMGLPNTPTIAAGAAAGASPTVAVVGNGIAGKITLTTGTTALSSGVLATVTLPVAYPTGTIVTLTNGDSDSALHTVRVFVTSTASTVVLNATGAALTDATQYVWNYSIVGY